MANLERLNRRMFLRGAGGAALALPYLEAMAPAASAADVPTRMVCIGNNFGFVPQLFFPVETGQRYEAPEFLQPLDHHRRRFTLFSQLDHGTNAVGGHGGVHAFLSGILSKNSKGFKEQNITVDQKAARHVGSATRFPSIQIACGASAGNRLSWSSAGVGIPPIENLETIFSLLFERSDATQLDNIKKAHIEKTSILDLVKIDADYLKKRVSKADQDKLDQFYTSVRSVEERLVQSAAWLDNPKPKVDFALPSGADGLDFIDRLPLYYDLIALALQTDSTRVMTFEISGLGANSGGLPITKGYHQLTHHGRVESYIQELAIIEKFQTTQFARFLDTLSGVDEPNGKSLLDNTMTLFGSGMGNASSHSNKNLPLLLAGGGFRHGQHLLFEKDKSRGIATPACNLFLSMLQRFGMEVDEFNLSTGTLTGLEVA